MTIEYIDIKPTTTKVTIGDYGEFTIRKFGAGEELELARIAREISEMSDGVKELDEYKDIEATKDKEKIAEAQKKISESMAKIQDLQNRQYALLRAVVNAEDEKTIDRLFNENTLLTLFTAIGKVARG